LIETLSPLNDNDILYIIYNLYPEYAERSQVRNISRPEKLEISDLNYDFIKKLREEGKR